MCSGTYPADTIPFHTTRSSLTSTTRSAVTKAAARARACRAPASFVLLISVSTGVAFAVRAAASKLFSAAAQLR